MAASTVMRLQTVVSREVAGTDTGRGRGRGRAEATGDGSHYVVPSRWLLGGADPAAFAGAADIAAIEKVLLDLPSNHSALFAPVIEPTLQTGVAALVRAAHTWLPE